MQREVLTSQLNITLPRMHGHDSPVINHAGRLVSEIGVACRVGTRIQREELKAEQSFRRRFNIL